MCSLDLPWWWPPTMTVTRSFFATMWVFSLYKDHPSSFKIYILQKTLATTLAVVEAKSNQNAGIVLTCRGGVLQCTGAITLQSFMIISLGQCLSQCLLWPKWRVMRHEVRLLRTVYLFYEVRTRTWAGAGSGAWLSMNYWLTTQLLSSGCRLSATYIQPLCESRSKVRTDQWLLSQTILRRRQDKCTKLECTNYYYYWLLY